MKGNRLLVQTTSQDPATVDKIYTQLKNLFEDRNMEIINTFEASTIHQDRAEAISQFSITTTMLLALAIIVAVVGGISLMGALSIGVVERTREIGVMRAIGARTRTIMGMFVMEGIVIEAPAVHEGLAFLLEHLPDNLHLVIATRTDPPLPLARLRLRDELLEIRAEALRFSLAEVATFFKQTVALELTTDEVAALAERTEGWVAALQAAALSLSGQPDVASFISTFSGGHRYIMDYLVDEVLQQQPESIQTFLLQTAILDRLNAPLSEAVTGQEHGQAILEGLEAANLFIVPLDDERRWYRYHHLFAEALRHRLEQTQPQNVPEYHRRASTWFEQQGLAAEAIHHALAGRDFERAATESLRSSPIL
jgi:hypothetical protein